MADNDEPEKTTRGNEWEVVLLTASAYAAAPGPEQVELSDCDKGNTNEDEAETSRAMFMSGHFVFPPSEHENLPVEPEDIEIHNVHGIEDIVPEPGAAEIEGRSDTKDEEKWSIKGMALPDEFPGIQFFDEMGNRLSKHGTEFEEEISQGVNLTEKGQNVYSSKFSSFHRETTMGGSTKYDENVVIPEMIEPSEGGPDSDLSQSPKLAKPARGDKYDRYGLPCEAWWKRRAASLYTQAKEANAVWSIFIAAAVMGLVILGQRWQQERWQVLQLKWQISINDEMGRMLGPLSRLKDVIVSGNRRMSSIRGSSSTDC
ncbi:ATG8-interacting protein 1-like isoform X2 [Actinidia eriantha]|uniref:ATG8-interacting protein 1-like isoform X2 n=1 Tax=Actinidia eriantha TaxID=165200 RepID=UPI00258A55AA|nr:ATG8-interacting protein 1-like isoform X2 [Actinidia eriantha]